MESSINILAISALISVKVPKQAKPAFLMLAPTGQLPLSRMRIRYKGNFSLNVHAAANPFIPEPRTII